MKIGAGTESGRVGAGMIAMVLLLVASSLPATGQEGDTPSEDFSVDEELAQRGEELFESKQCVTCHTVGDGIIIGPDLKGLLDRREIDWIRRIIAQPVEMTAEDSLARALKAEFDEIQMPTPNVTEEEVEALIHYIASEGSGGG